MGRDKENRTNPSRKVIFPLRRDYEWASRVEVAVGWRWICSPSPNKSADTNFDFAFLFAC